MFKRFQKSCTFESLTSSVFVSNCILNSVSRYHINPFYRIVFRYPLSSVIELRFSNIVFRFRDVL